MPARLSRMLGPYFVNVTVRPAASTTRVAGNREAVESWQNRSGSGAAMFVNLAKRGVPHVAASFGTPSSSATCVMKSGCGATVDEGAPHAMATDADAVRDHL